ncbi:MAG: hypothetical protein NTX04_09645, partial [Verrucomicrobia bacterium]|nr:hypothetical protein [Verrucomicrobiota bacterium]
MGRRATFALASLWFFFRSLHREGHSPKRFALHSLRFLAALLVALTLLRPERVLIKKRSERPRVVVLYDASGSMETKDVVAPEKQMISRAAWIKSQLDAQAFLPLEKQYEVSIEPFAKPPKNPPNSNLETEVGSDLNAPLDRLLKQYGDLRAVVLLSDGDRNLGPSPVTAATALAQRDIPIFTVGVGSENYLPDLELQSVVAPTYGLINERISVLFTLQNHLPREVKTTVTLNGPGDAKGSKIVTLPPMSQVQDSLIFTPITQGEGDYTVRIPVEPDEVSSTNNQQTFHLAVRKETLKVLVVDSQPRWEFRYLRNALLRDPGVSLNTVLYHPSIGLGEGEGYLKEFPAKREDLQGYDVIFLGDVGVGPEMLSTENAQMIKGLVEQQASGLVLLPGPLGRQKSLATSPLADLLPVETDYSKGSGFASGAEARLDLTARARDHRLTMLSTDLGMPQSSKPNQAPRSSPFTKPPVPPPAGSPSSSPAPLAMARSSTWAPIPLGAGAAASKTPTTIASGAKSSAGWLTNATSPKTKASASSTPQKPPNVATKSASMPPSSDPSVSPSPKARSPSPSPPPAAPKK